MQAVHADIVDNAPLLIAFSPLPAGYVDPLAERGNSSFSAKVESFAEARKCVRWDMNHAFLLQVRSLK